MTTCALLLLDLIEIYFFLLFCYTSLHLCRLHGQYIHTRSTYPFSKPELFTTEVEGGRLAPETIARACKTTESVDQLWINRTVQDSLRYSQKGPSQL